MRSLVILITLTLLSVSCASTLNSSRTASSGRAARAEEKRLAVENIIQSGNFLIKMDRIDAGRGLTAQLAPDFNYLLLEQGMLRMKLGYVGRQYSFRGVSAINMSGKPSQYEMERNASKGIYDIRVKVSQGGEPFDIYLSVTDRGFCYMSIVNPRLEPVRYSGKLVIPQS